MFWKLKEDIFVEDDLVFIEDRVMVPMTLQIMMIEKVHEGHFGVNRTILRAKSIMYWLDHVGSARNSSRQTKSSR